MVKLALPTFSEVYLNLESIANSKKVDKFKLYDMGSETRLEGLIGNCFNFRFNYRSECGSADLKVM